MKTGWKNAIALIFLLGGAAFLFWSQYGERTINAYLDGVRPHLQASDALTAEFNTWAQKNQDADDAFWANGLVPFVEKYRGIAARIQAVQADDAEIAELKAKLDLFAQKRLAWFEGLLASSKRGSGNGGPPPDLDGLVAEANEALAAFMALKEAYFSKYRLEEQGS